MDHDNQQQARNSNDNDKNNNNNNTSHENHKEGENLQTSSSFNHESCCITAEEQAEMRMMFRLFDTNGYDIIDIIGYYSASIYRLSKGDHILTKL